jgi:hypothetical protein
MGRLSPHIQESSSDVTTGSIIANGRRKFTDPSYYPNRQDNCYKPSDCNSQKMPPADLEEMLAAQFGNRLQPKRGDRKSPKIIDFTNMNCSPESIAKRAEKKKTSKVNEPAKLQPKHLTAERLRELIAQGKKSTEVLRMYSFTSQDQFLVAVKELGCRDLLGVGGCWNE